MSPKRKEVNHERRVIEQREIAVELQASVGVYFGLKALPRQNVVGAKCQCRECELERECRADSEAYGICSRSSGHGVIVTLRTCRTIVSISTTSNGLVRKLAL